MEPHAHNRKPQDIVVAANRWLDSAAQLNILRRHYGLSNKEIAKIHSELVGAGLGRKILWEFDTKKRASLPGIWEVNIAYAADTASGLAIAALNLELVVRRANNSHLFEPSGENLSKLERELESASREYGRLHRMLKHFVPAPGDDTGRALDIASVDFGRGQIHIVRARIAKDHSERKHHLSVASTLMASVSERLKHAVRTGMRLAEVMEIVLAVNAALNEYFAAWELDDLEENPADLVRATSVALKYARPLFLKAANDSAIEQNDARVAFNAASIAGLARQTQAAAASLELSARLDGHVGPIMEWEPDWLPEPLANSTELADAIKLINLKGK